MVKVVKLEFWGRVIGLGLLGCAYMVSIILLRLQVAFVGFDG